jgi:transcriptional regulator with XRE-family HTH domain
MGEKLKWLMQTLNISGIELADHLGVDYSIVSKWRTGKRVLKYRSAHAKKLATFMLTSPAEKEGRIVRNMLKERYPELDADDQSKLENALCLWLTVHEKPELSDTADDMDITGIFSVQVETALGIKNAFREQYRFFHMLQEMQPGQLVTITDFGAVSWTGVDIAQIEETVQETLRSLDCGHRFRIVDQITETYRPWDFMFRFIPVYLHENVTSYFYRDPQPSPLRQNMYIVEGRAALTISSTQADPELVITSFYQQPEYVQFYDSINASIMEGSHLMIQTMRDQHIHELLDIIDAHMKSSRLLYMINRKPTFRNMTQELLREILEQNHVSAADQELCLSAGRKSTSIRGRCKSRQIYDLDAIEALADKEEIIEYDLSAILGRKIKLNQQQFLCQLEHLKQNIRDDEYSLVLYPFSKLKMDTPPPFNIIVQDDSLSAAWDVEKYSRRMYSEDLSIVNGFYQYAQSVWDHIPPVSKTEEWCKRQIDRILATHQR